MCGGEERRVGERRGEEMEEGGEGGEKGAASFLTLLSFLTILLLAQGRRRIGRVEAGSFVLAGPVGDFLLANKG